MATPVAQGKSPIVPAQIASGREAPSDKAWFCSSSISQSQIKAAATEGLALEQVHQTGTRRSVGQNLVDQALNHGFEGTGIDRVPLGGAPGDPGMGKGRAQGGKKIVVHGSGKSSV